MSEAKAGQVEKMQPHHLKGWRETNNLSLVLGQLEEFCDEAEGIPPQQPNLPVDETDPSLNAFLVNLPDQLQSCKARVRQCLDRLRVSLYG